ncbi:MAG: helicase-associated domain-containing protein, partial [Thermomicrobiales bacterium]
RAVREAGGAVALDDAMRAAGLASARGGVARQRAALAELEGALLVWHSYRRDGTRWLFVPREIRESGHGAPPALPALQFATAGAGRWRPPDAFAWDLLTVLRLLSNPNAPAWTRAEPAPRWLRRVAAPLLWFGERDETPDGYFALMQAVGLAEGVFLADESVQPARIVPGPQARAWRRLAFPEMTARLRSRWLNLPTWVEGDAAGIVDVRGADWRGMRPRLLAALREAAREEPAGDWVTLESLIEWVVAAQPALLGQSFRAATARAAGEIAGDVTAEEARAAALGDIVGFEVAGPCVWFGLTALAVSPEGVRVARVLPERPPARSGPEEMPTAGTTLEIGESGEISAVAPSPERVWALSAFAELVDLGEISRYRLTSQAVAGALSAGVRHDQIVEYLERASERPLPEQVAASLAAWVQRLRIVRLEPATVLDLDDASACDMLARHLRRHGWAVTGLTDRQLLVRPGPDAALDLPALRQMLEGAGFSPRTAADIEAQAPTSAPDTTGDA